MLDVHGLPWDAASEKIWREKYRFGDEARPEDTWLRIAKALAQAEKAEDRERHENNFYDAMNGFKFLPAGRIVAGAGTGRAVTLMNCYTMGTIHDSMDGIFSALREAALTMQQGGGIGYDFSTIRPKGSRVIGVGADASGPLSFMDCWNSMCKTVMSAGTRRGAMMACLRCDHPDIEDFIAAKADPKRLRMFNMSVLVTDAFMAAVGADGGWPLVFGGEYQPISGTSIVPPGGSTKVYKIVRARELWDKIMRATYAYAEPGVIFIDRVNRLNNLNYVETIACSNPCGEQIMGPYSSCDLGSINLTAFVKNPFAVDGAARFDYEAIGATTRSAIRMMDDVIDVTNYPLPQQRDDQTSKRRLGLGVTGLGDALIMLSVRYGTELAASIAGKVMGVIERVAYTTSINLAVEKGAFPLWNDDDYATTGTHAAAVFTELDPTWSFKYDKTGIRNSHLTSVAPTGTISYFANNISGGCEPVFADEYDRKVLLQDGAHRTERMGCYSRRLWYHLGRTGKPPAMITAAEIAPADHVRMQAALQKHVDSAISKTTNLPESISFEDFADVYRLAYDQGCKGITTYRPNDVTGSVLTAVTDDVVVSPGEKALEELSRIASAMTPNVPDIANVVTAPTVRAVALNGKTYKLRWPESEHAYYLTINDDANGRPFEVFLNTKDPSDFPWVAALTRMISAIFRRGGDVSFVVEELKAVFDPRGGHRIPPGHEMIPSLIALIGRTIESHTTSQAEHELFHGKRMTKQARCPQCQQLSIIFAEGCATCTQCDYSKCG